MTPMLPQVDPIPAAAPPLVFWLLLMLTFTLHVVAMNAVLGGSIVGAAARWIGANGHPHHARLARLIGAAMPVAIATAVTLGVAALLFLQVLYGRAFFPSSILMARAWLAVVPLLIFAYYAAYWLSSGDGNRAACVSVAVAAIFSAIAFIMSNNMGLMLRVGELPGLFAADARGVYLNSTDPAMMPRYLHMLLGAIATAGLMVAIVGVLMRRDQLFSGWAIRWGAVWFAGATALNVPLGIWWLGVLPADVVTALIGGELMATTVLAAGTAILLAALGLIFVAAHSSRPAPWVYCSAAALFAGIVLMLLTRDFVRQQALDAAGFAPPTLVAPQWSLIVIFLVLLVVAIATVGWMARKLSVGSRPSVP